MTYTERLEAFANDEPEAKNMVPNVSDRTRLKVDATGFLALGELMAEALGKAQKPKRETKKTE